MKNISAITKILSLVVLGTLISACAHEPPKTDSKETIKGAPDWVNKGSIQSTKDGRRVFIGVGSANPQGDLALQKSIADDKSIAEVANILSAYLDAVSSEYSTNSKSHENSTGDELVSRKLTEEATRQVIDGVSRQIDGALTRQFKEKVSTQFKDDVTRQINQVALRPIRETVSSQIEFSLQLEEIISQQIKEAVLRQIKNTIKTSMANARITGSWRDPYSGTIWSISELDIKFVKSALAVTGDMNTDLKRYFEINAEGIFDRVISDKENTDSSFFKW